MQSKVTLNDRSAISGVIVIGAGQVAAIELPWGAFTLIFKPEVSPPGVHLTTASSPPEIVFEGTDNPLGLASTLNIPLSSGEDALLNFAVYAVGEGENVTRIVHYTAG